MVNMQGPLLVFFLVGVTYAAGLADISVHPIFSDGMVVQHGKPIYIYGGARWANMSVLVKYRNQRKTVFSGDDRTWKVAFDPEDPSYIGQDTEDMIISALSTTLLLKNVRVGDVWIVAGTHMTTPLSACDEKESFLESKQDLEDANMRNVLSRYSGLKGGRWISNDDDSQYCLGAFFALERYYTTGHYIGIIEIGSAYSGIRDWYGSGSLYQYNIAPLQPFQHSGVIWDSGEKDGGGHAGLTAEQYSIYLEEMIDEWRNGWAIQGFDKNFPFLMVQLGNGATGFRDIRLGQFNVFQNPRFFRLGLVATIDLPTQSGKDTTRKDIIAKRLEKFAAAYDDYNVADCPGCAGPTIIFESAMSRKDSHHHPYVTLQLQYFGSGLIVSCANEDGDFVPGFEIKTDIDGWAPAHAMLTDFSTGTMEIWPAVSKSFSGAGGVRYQYFGEIEEACITSKDHTPLFPFAIDNLEE